MMWVGTKDRGISIGNPGAMAFGLHRAGKKGALPAGTVRSFSEAPDGNLWVASDGGGLVRYNLEARTYRMFGQASGLNSNRLCSVLYDSQGNLFVGTDGAGLFKFDPRTETAKAVSLGLGEDSGIAAEGGPVVWALYEDREKNLWVGLEGSGLVELKADGTRKRYTYKPNSGEGLGGRSVRSIQEDGNGNLLVGTWDGGLQRIDPRTGVVEQFPSQDGTERSTSDVSIYYLLRDSKNNVWIGTGSGLDRYEMAGGSLRIRPVNLGFLPRRPSVFGIAEDGTGTLWLSTEMGLLSYDPSSEDMKRWTRSDGLQDDHFAPGASLRLQDGQLAFGGIKGFNLFNPRSLEDRTDPPAVRIVSLMPLEKTGPEERSNRIPSSKNPIKVPYSASAFALTLAVLDFTDPGKNLFALRIEGKQSQRYYLGASNRAIVPRLAPGTYRFIAAGAGNRGVWNENGSSILVEVVPPFWMSPQGIVTFILMGLLILFIIFKLRILSLERRTQELRALSAHIHDAREEERAEIAREVHDQLGQTLTALKIGLYWTKNNAQLAQRTMEEKLSELLEYTDLALESVKSISTRLRPSVLDTLSLSEALEWLVNDFRHWSTVECDFLSDITPQDLDYKTKTTIFRLLQENLTNIARHSQATKAEIRLSINTEWISLTIRDNGVGIDPARRDANTSFGIAGMRERCSYLGGSFELFPGPNGGTMMIARLPNHKPGEVQNA
jgi:signal transduction histidine kinase